MTLTNKRNAVADGLGKIAIVGLTLAIVAGISVFAFTMFDSNASVVSIDFTDMKIQKISGDSSLVGTIVNRGSDGIRDFEIELSVDTDSGAAGIQPFEPTLSVTDVDQGKSMIVDSLIVDTGATAISLAQGEQYKIVYKGNSTSGPFQKTTQITVK